MVNTIVSKINSTCIQSIVSPVNFWESNQVILAYENIEKKITSGMV